jgi:hypothetical protein
MAELSLPNSAKVLKSEHLGFEQLMDRARLSHDKNRNPSSIARLGLFLTLNWLVRDPASIL